MKIGQYNVLPVVRLVDFGAYLGDEKENVLLPARYISRPLKPGDEVEVFIYNDSADRLIATTEHPLATVGQFAFLNCVAVERVGAFLDWGLMKDLLVPFSEQKSRMRVGGNYLVYVYLDDASKRIAATAKVERYLGNAYPDYTVGQQVDVLVTGETEIGFTAIVENRHSGMVYKNETFVDLQRGDAIKAYIKQVRPDGKIDLSIAPSAKKRTGTLSDSIVDYMRINDGRLQLNDKSSPEAIKAAFHCSKRDFKQAIGHLFKSGKIGRDGEFWSLLADK